MVCFNGDFPSAVTSSKSWTTVVLLDPPVKEPPCINEMSLGTRGGFLHFVFCSASTTGPKLQSRLTVRGAVNVTLGMVMTTTTTTRTTTTRKKKKKKKEEKMKMKMKMNYQKG